MSRTSAEVRSGGQFPSTRWSRIVAAGSRDSAEAGESLAELCEAYWYPLYAFIRRKGYAPEEARDQTQEFFAYLLDREVLAKADPARGRFRGFLRTICAVRGQPARTRSARKRGGGAVGCRSTPSTQKGGMSASWPIWRRPSGSSTGRGRSRC